MTRTGLGRVHVALQPYVLRNWLVGQGLVAATWPFVLSRVPGRWHVPNTRLPRRSSLVISAGEFSACASRTRRLVCWRDDRVEGVVLVCYLGTRHVNCLFLWEGAGGHGTMVRR